MRQISRRMLPALVGIALTAGIATPVLSQRPMPIGRVLRNPGRIERPGEVVAPPDQRVNLEFDTRIDSSVTPPRTVTVKPAPAHTWAVTPNVRTKTAGNTYSTQLQFKSSAPFLMNVPYVVAVTGEGVAALEQTRPGVVGDAEIDPFSDVRLPLFSWSLALTGELAHVASVSSDQEVAAELDAQLLGDTVRNVKLGSVLYYDRTDPVSGVVSSGRTWGTVATFAFSDATSVTIEHDFNSRFNGEDNTVGKLNQVLMPGAYGKPTLIVALGKHKVVSVGLGFSRTIRPRRQSGVAPPR